MQRNAVRLGYFLAISLLLSALFYFFAANWPALDRWGKIGVSVSVLVLFYALSYAGGLVLNRHSFLSNWLLVAGGLSFGISVALLGQIYNSHADSYMLFVVWLIPNLLFAVATRYQPFYVISYVLAHLAVCFFLDPSVIHVTRDEEWWYMVYWLIALGNIALFWMTGTERLKSRPVHYLSFLVFQVSLFLSAFADVYGALPECLYLLIGGGLFLVFLKWMPNRAMLVLTATLLALFLLGKFFWLMFEYNSDLFFLAALLAAAGIVWGVVAGMRWLRRQSTREDSKWVRFILEAFTVLVTLVAGTMGATSLTGLFYLLLPGSLASYVLYFLALLGFLIPVIIRSKLDTTVFYTLLTMGYLIATGSSLFLGGYYWVIFLLALAYAWVASGSTPVRLLTQFVFLLVLYIKMGDWSIPGEWALLVLFVFQLGMYMAPRLPVALQNSSLVYALLSLLVLAETVDGGSAVQVGANLGYFAFTTYLVYRTMHRKERIGFGIALGFWFAFLLMKYYDFFWSLLHKSISLLLLSLVFFAVSYWLDRSAAAQREVQPLPIFADKRKRLAIFSVVLLQLVAIGYQIWSSETILAEGRSVKLRLEPIDPRSLLQGDYVRLGYAISTLEGEQFPDADGKIRVVLRPESDGVYVYGGYYEQNGVWNRPHQPGPDEIILNGRTIGTDRVEYGIESYFVPEGTGREVERTAKYALVRVGKKGDAIVEELSN